MPDLAKYPQPPTVKWPWAWRGTGYLSRQQIAEQARAAQLLHDHFMSKPIPPRAP